MTMDIGCPLWLGFFVGFVLIILKIIVENP